MKASCSQGLQMSLPLSLSGCNPFLSSSISLLPSPALRFVCFSFSSLFFFCRSRLRRGVCCLPDAEMDYWINSSIGCSASQRLEVREVINSQPSPFAHCKGAEAIDLADSAGFRSHITVCISVGNKSIYIFDVSLSNKKRNICHIIDTYTHQGKKCGVCEMLQPFQQQGASFETHACRPGDHGIASNGDKPFAVQGSAPTQGSVGRWVAVPVPVWVPALEAVAICCSLPPPVQAWEAKREVQRPWPL